MALDNVSAFFKIDFSRCLHSLRVLLVHATVLRSETALVVSYSTVSKLGGPGIDDKKLGGPKMTYGDNARF